MSRAIKGRYDHFKLNVSLADTILKVGISREITAKFDPIKPGKLQINKVI